MAFVVDSSELEKLWRILVGSFAARTELRESQQTLLSPQLVPFCGHAGQSQHIFSDMNKNANNYFGFLHSSFTQRTSSVGNSCGQFHCWLFLLMISYRYGFKAFPRLTGPAFGHYNRVIYLGTHIRMGPWLIGFLLAYVLFKVHDKNIKINRVIKHSRVHNTKEKNQ